MILFVAQAAASSSTPSWVGSIPTWALLIMGLFVAWRVTKGGGGSAVSELSVANQVLEDRDKRRQHEMEAQAGKIAALESKTDVVLAVTPLISEHERHSQERFEATIQVLEAIRDQIHADTPGK